MQAAAPLDVLAHPRRLFGDKGLKAHFTALHHVQCLLPDRGGARIGDGARHRVDQAEGGRGGGQRFAVFAQVAAVQQALNDAGAGGFGADPGGVLEFLLEQRVLHQLGDVFHGLDQIALGEGFGRLGPQVFEQHVGNRTIQTFAQQGQRLRRRGFAFGGGQGLGQCAFPAGFDDLLAHCAQGLARAIEVGLGAVVLMIGQELRQITCAYQRIDSPRFARQAFKVFGCRRGDDAVVSADFGVVPGP